MFSFIFERFYFRFVAAVYGRWTTRDEKNDNFFDNLRVEIHFFCQFRDDFLIYIYL